jgi:hypothetical protein
LNYNDQADLREYLDQISDPAYGATPPNFVADSWQNAGIQSSILDYFDGNNLSGNGYLALLAGIDFIINNNSMAKAMPKDKGAAIYLASALNPQQHGYDYDRIKKNGHDYNQRSAGVSVTIFGSRQWANV